MAAVATDLAPHVRGRLDQISTMLSTDTVTPALSLETLLDTFLALYTDCRAASPPAGPMSNFLTKYEKLIFKLQALRINTADFEVMKTLATGAVGKVCLVKHRSTRKLYAMKILKKIDLLTRQEAAFFMEERDALVFAKESQWITTLYAAFQDEENLYLVLEYASGGSLRALLNNREESMPEDQARFYIAQILLSLDELHRHSFIHRDVKPENCLIDASGHVKLADFGSCIRMGDTKTVTSHETVGTPDYISPEILRAHEGNTSYGRECDWWSLGIIMYEVLFDEVPFYSESLMETYGKIMDHEKHFAFPDDIPISDEAADIMRKLICKKDVRLGRNGSKDIQDHPWFKGFDWDAVRKMTPPFVPELSGPDDTRYFEDEDNESKKVFKKTIVQARTFTGQNLPFVGYSYLQGAQPNISWRIGSSPDSIQDLPSTTNLGSLLAGVVKRDSSVRSISGSDAELRGATDMAAKQKAELEAKIVALTGKNADLQTSLLAAESKRDALSGTLAEARTARDQETRAKDETKRTLAELETVLRQERGERVDVETVRAEKSQLEKELERARGQVKQLSHDLSTQRTITVELQAASGKLSDEMEALRTREDTARESSEAKLRELSVALEAERKQKAELQLLNEQLSQKSQTITLEYSALQAALDTNGVELRQMKEKAMHLEKDLSAANIELESAAGQQTTLQQTIAELRSRQVNAVSTQESEIEDLRMKLTESSDRIANLVKSAASLKIEADEASKREAADVAAHVITKDKLKALTVQVQEERQRSAALQRDMSDAEGTHRLALQEEVARRGKAEQALSQKEQAVSVLQRELEVAKAETQKQQRRAQRSIDFENLYFEAQSSIETLQTQLTDARAKIRNVGDTNRPLEADHARLRAVHEQSERDLEECRSRIKDAAADLQAAQNRGDLDRQRVATLSETLAEQRIMVSSLEETLVAQSDKIEVLTSSQMDATARVHELEVQCSLGETQTRNLKERIHELEQTCTALHAQLDGTEDGSSSRRAESLLSSEKGSLGEYLSSHSRGIPRSPEKTSTASPSRPKAGWKNMLFRTNSQPLKMDHARSISQTASSQELNDEASKQWDGQVQRRPSAASSFSMKSYQTKSSDALTEFSIKDGLKGWLKVPKGGKVKKGWKQRYAVVRDFKVYMYDRDRDVGSGEGTLIADLRCDIFIAKPVAQNELIHANGKDIDCIFKIQSANVAISSSITELPSSTKEAESLVTQRRITKLEGEILLEEKMLQAAEKMWSLSSESNRTTLDTQIAATQGRLAALREELDVLSMVDAEVASADTLEPTVYNESTAEADIVHWRKKLEAQLTEEKGRVAVLSKAPESPSKKDKTRNSMIVVDPELAASERTIARIKEDLEGLASRDREAALSVVARLKDENASGSHGHPFKLRQYYKPTDCAVCHEPLWGNTNQGYECTVCKMICHKPCKSMIDISCPENRALATAQPLVSVILATHPTPRIFSV
ncbi:hypothetical protein HKX48_004913 [Thoreauomyces humboldtii]|nr:hypothetical protein HKX48_004913 [Thoreauomyces humboldtii]